MFGPRLTTLEFPASTSASSCTHTWCQQQSPLPLPLTLPPPPPPPLPLPLPLLLLLLLLAVRCASTLRTLRRAARGTDLGTGVLDAFPGQHDLHELAGCGRRRLERCRELDQVCHLRGRGARLLQGSHDAHAAWCGHHTRECPGCGEICESGAGCTLTAIGVTISSGHEASMLTVVDARRSMAHWCLGCPSNTPPWEMRPPSACATGTAHTAAASWSEPRIASRRRRHFHHISVNCYHT